MVALVSSYPFLSILWTILICFALVIGIWTVVMALIDIFSRPDLSGWSKAAWVVFIIVLPFLGALCYLIANSAGSPSGADAKAAHTQLARRRVPRIASVIRAGPAGCERAARSSNQ